MHKKILLILIFTIMSLAYNNLIVIPRAIQNSIAFNRQQLLGGSLRNVGRANIYDDVASQSKAFYEGATLSFILLASSWLICMYTVSHRDK